MFEGIQVYRVKENTSLFFGIKKKFFLILKKSIVTTFALFFSIYEICIKTRLTASKANNCRSIDRMVTLALSDNKSLLTGFEPRIMQKQNAFIK